MRNLHNTGNCLKNQYFLKFLKNQIPQVAHRRLANVIRVKEVASVDVNHANPTSKNFRMRIKEGKWLRECFIKNPMELMR